jgi:HTH-type transcriptional regulator/antitoxin HigA
MANLLQSAEEARKVPRMLAECGIRFIIVESLKAAKIDGVCIWLDKHSPVIGISFRFDRIDNFGLSCATRLNMFCADTAWTPLS